MLETHHSKVVIILYHKQNIENQEELESKSIDLFSFFIAKYSQRERRRVFMEYASSGQGTLGVTLGAIGTGLSVLNGGLGLLNGNVGNNNYHNTEGGRYITKDELDYVQTIARKDSEIALLKSEQNTEIKISDVYERIMTRVNADQRAQADINASQAVYNASANSAIAVLQNQVSVLNSLTKTIVPITNVCPEPMKLYNSWTAPTTPTTGA